MKQDRPIYEIVGCPYITISNDEMIQIRAGKNIAIRGVEDFISGPDGAFPQYSDLKRFLVINRDRPTDNCFFDMDNDQMESMQWFDGLKRVYKARNTDAFNRVVENKVAGQISVLDPIEC